jgi:hypothetical protein
MAMEIDSQMRIDAMKRAEKIFTDIIDATHTPTKQIVGEALKIYEEFEAWGWFDNYPIEDKKNRWLYINEIAMQLYRSMKWEKEHPSNKPKLSKWEVVHGIASNKRR